jgi:hypothetical protein
MADTLVYGRIKADQLEETRVLSARGKQETALLIVLVGTAASLQGSTVFPFVPNEVINDIKYITSYKGNVFLTVLNAYPNDVVAGYDNFDNYWPEAPFVQQRTVQLVSVLTDYTPYNSSLVFRDVIGKAFRQKVEFYIEPDFIQQWKINPQPLIFKPVPPVGDLSTQYKRPVEFFDTPYWDISQENAGRMVVMMPQLAPIIEVNIYAGGGRTLGRFFKNVLLGRFH